MTIDRIDLRDVTVDFRREEVRGCDGARIELRPRSFGVLRYLAGRAGEVVTKDDLLTECWPGVVVTEDSLTQCICEIRRALGESGRDLIRTVSRRGYRLVPPAPDESFARTQGVWPSIAILPFDEFSGEAERGLRDWGPLGAGFAEDITTELARDRALTVLARHTSFAAKAKGMVAAEIARQFHVRYVLEGSIRRAGARIIVNAQLIDSRDSCHVWAERYTCAAHGLFKAQDELAGRIAGTLFSEIRETVKAASLRRPPADLDVYELTVRGIAHKHQLSGAGMIAGRADLERAVALDSLYAPAHIYLGYGNAVDAAMALSGSLGADAIPEAIATIRHGIELDPTLAVGHQALGVALSYLDQREDSLRAAERSVVLGPGDADNLLFLGLARTGLGQYAEGLACIERATALNPLVPPFYSRPMALVLYALGRYEDSLRHAADAIARIPRAPVGYLYAAAAEMELGRRDAARAHVTALLRQVSTFTMQSPIARLTFSRDAVLEARFKAALREAGLPSG